MHDQRADRGARAFRTVAQSVMQRFWEIDGGTDCHAMIMAQAIEIRLMRLLFAAIWPAISTPVLNKTTIHIAASSGIRFISMARNAAGESSSEFMGIKELLAPQDIDLATL
jgi:hypothetical protein